jgi:hypothetical protein
MIPEVDEKHCLMWAVLAHTSERRGVSRERNAQADAQCCYASLKPTPKQQANAGDQHPPALLMVNAQADAQRRKSGRDRHASNRTGSRLTMETVLNHGRNSGT